MKLMLLGTASGVGKTTLVALLCRCLSKKGLKVIPFKGSNLSLNSYVTASGEEIGMGQAFQAWAAGIEPTVGMNPILMKPSGKGVIQVILNGHPLADISPGCHPDTSLLLDEVCQAYDNAHYNSDIVICEGSGSPVELNLMGRDVANMLLVKKKRIPAVIVGDIERGGVFAAIYGTWRLVPEEDRHFLKGFIINRFRGDPSILKSGIDTIERLTGMIYMGTVPYANLKFPEEDSMSMGNGRLEGKDMISAFIANLDELNEGIELGIDYEIFKKIVSEDP